MLTEKHLLMLNIIIGMKKPVKGRVILSIMRKLHGIITDLRTLRYLKEDLLEDGWLIGSHNSKGYFIIETPAELEEARSEYKKKALNELYKCNLLQKNFELKSGVQMPLFTIIEEAENVGD